MDRLTSSVPLAPTAIGEWAGRQPSAPALVHSGGTVSYGELWSKAKAWAGALRPYLDGSDSTYALVGVLAQRGPLVPVGQLAAWLAGAGYLQLDPAVPAGRLASIITRSRCTAVLTTDDLTGLVPPGVATVTAPAEPVAPVRTAPTDLANVIYTSGSTGEPKGVETEQRSLGLLLSWYADFYRLGPGDRTSMLSNLGFDGLVVDVWGALYCGAAVAVPEQSVVASPQRIANFLTMYDVTHTNMPTPMLERFLRAKQRPGRVRAVETGGDQLRVWPGRDFPAPVFNAYGPTEATVQVTITGDIRQAGTPDRLPPLGRALPSADVHLIDPAGATITTVGAVGELVIGGPMLARGYRCDPDLTAHAFRPCRRTGERLYHTGDMCRWNEDGELEFLGRRDHQVKIQGYRVELGEIEQTLMRHPGIRMAAVMLSDDGRLTAWAEGTGDPETVLADLRHRLPDYMVPGTLEFLPELPMTANGKTDRQRLIAATTTAR